MTHLVDANSDLGQILHTMPGLNKQTSENGIAGTCDPKHVIKCRLILQYCLSSYVDLNFRICYSSSQPIWCSDT